MSTLAEHRPFLRDAAAYLENPSFTLRLAALVGRPLETAARKVMPQRVLLATTAALRKVMDLAARSVPERAISEKNLWQRHETAGWDGWWHTLATVGTGTVGGFLGFAGLALELPLTTAIMFRSIASIAAHHGEDLSDGAVRLECLAVFSHGVPQGRQKQEDSSYFAARLASASLIREAALFLTNSSADKVAEALARGTAPALMELLAYVAAEFNAAVTGKALATAVPLLGGATGAAINVAFTEHFNKVARYHFGIRSLERQFGPDAVRQAYQELARQSPS
jgi:hypothetical protein